MPVEDLSDDLTATVKALRRELAARDAAAAEANAFQAAANDVLKAMSASPGATQPVYEIIARRASELCGSRVGITELRDGLLYLKTTHGFSPEALAPWASTFPRVPTRDTLTGLAVVERRIVHFRPGADTSIARDRLKLLGGNTGVMMPILRDGEPLGAIGMNSDTADGFSDSQIALLQTFAEQATIAVTSADTYRALQQRNQDYREALEQQTATTEVLQIINASQHDLQAVFDGILRTAARICGPVSANISLSDGSHNRMVSGWNIAPAYAEHLKGGWTSTPGGRTDSILKGLSHYHIPDVAADTEYLAASSNMRAFFEIGGARTVMWIPLRNGDRQLGLIIFWRLEKRPFSDKEIRLLLIFADQATIAIISAENHHALRAARDDAEQASRTIEAAYRDLKSAQANLIQAEKMASLGQLTAGIAHEIKNPLNFINNFSDLSVELLSELRDIIAPAVAKLDAGAHSDVDDLTATLTSNLQKITAHGRRADGIVRSMLEHSRGASGERQTVDVNAMVEDALNLAYHGARAQDPHFDITLQRQYATSIAPITLTPQDIIRVLLNLFSNGFYAANKRAKVNHEPDFEPRLTVITRDLGEAVEIRVRDNGIGVPLEIRDKLFLPFFTTKPSGEGTGLGLSITYDIVTKQHGGTIAVESEPGAFTEFTVVLPRSNA